MTRTLITIAALAICLASPAVAQSPGWHPTGGWQCGPHTQISTSVDGRDGIDFFVAGAWFDNHFTLRRGDLFYNGVPCAPFGSPFGLPPRLSKSEGCLPDIAENREALRNGAPVCE
jgi:hypothetical protein